MKKTPIYFSAMICNSGIFAAHGHYILGVLIVVSVSLCSFFAIWYIFFPQSWRKWRERNLERKWIKSEISSSIRDLRSTDWGTREHAAKRLAEIGDKSSILALITALEDRELHVRLAAA